MKENIIEYYPNGQKMYEQYFDQQGKHHREQGLPDYQEWYQNGKLGRKAYCVHGKYHNICNPSVIKFNDNGKIWTKFYYLNNNNYSKLNWQNQIKNI